jgi:S1/P1 Nuclease
MRKFLALALLIILATPAFAWNEKGHMVVARLAWRQLTDKQRDQVLGILKKHPHYDEYLAAKKPDGFSEDEWVFMRAATWADWVRSHHAEEFNHGPWHYINYPVVPPGSKVDPAKHQPTAGQENVVNILARCMEKIQEGNDVEKAVYMTWLFHLVGDIHQPLHCVAMFS